MDTPRLCSVVKCGNSAAHLVAVTCNWWLDEECGYALVPLCENHAPRAPIEDYSRGTVSYEVVTKECWPFSVGGEVLTLNDAGREVDGEGRKPSKWSVETEEISEDEALRRHLNL